MCRRAIFMWAYIVACGQCVLGQSLPPELGSLEQQLQQEPAEHLAEEARRRGDPARGAILFHQPQLACSRCHSVGEGQSPLGPDLAISPAGEGRTPASIVESVLFPSKTIRKGYELVQLQLEDGTVKSGMLVSENEREVALRDPGPPSQVFVVPRQLIETRQTALLSVMPAGTANFLNGRNQFLDLMAYLLAINEQGPARAKELQPDESLYRAPPRAPDTSADIVQVYTTMMPNSGPAALAIGLGENLWVCFDRSRGGINYLWQGMLDLSPTVQQKINQPAIVNGTIFYTDNTRHPLLTTIDGSDSTFRFRGYRFLDDAVELHYRVGEVNVRETLSRLRGTAETARVHEIAADVGIQRDLIITGIVPCVWIELAAQDTAAVEVHPTLPRAGNRLRVDLHNGIAEINIQIRPRGIHEHK